MILRQEWEIICKLAGGFFVSQGNWGGAEIAATKAHSREQCPDWRPTGHKAVPEPWGVIRE